MKKIIVLVILTTLSFVSVSKEPQGLFGFNIGDNVLNHISEEDLNQKEKNSESKGSFYDVWPTARTHNKSPFFSDYQLIIDKYNKVQGVAGWQSIVSLDICLKQRDEVEAILTGAYDINLESFEATYPDFVKYALFYDGSKGYIELQCQEDNSNKDVLSVILLYSHKYSQAVEDFYNSGI